MPQINLLPEELSPKGSIIRLATGLKTIVLVGFVILIVVTGGLVAYLTFTSFEIKTLHEKEEQLKQQISALNESEQRLVLLKDRLEKINLVLNSDSSNQEVDKLISLYSLVPSEMRINQLEISPNNTRTDLLATNSLDLTQFMANLVVSDLYSLIKLTTFGFNPRTGYSVAFEMQSK